MGYKYPEHVKDITIPLIIHYYLLRAPEHYTNLSTPTCRTSGFSVFATRVGIMQYVYALNPVYRFNYL